MIDHRRAWGASTLALTAALTLLAGARPSAAHAAASEGSLNEIIVTAQKREQPLRDVPVSIAAITGQQIEDMKISDLRSIQGYVPNLAVLNSGVNPVVYIRGFGSGPNNVAFDQEVSVYMDGIYGGRGAQFSAPFFDLDHMEVLRGPQGALFGRNTAAGAISLVSAKPGRSSEGTVTAGYDFERRGYDVSTVLSGPVSDTLGVRFAAKTTHESGYIRNRFNGSNDPKLRDELARLTAVWTPSDKVDVTAKVEHGKHLLLGGVTVSGSLVAPTDFDALAATRYISDNYAQSSIPEQSGIRSWNDAITANFSLGEHTLTAIGGYSHFLTQRFSAYDETSPDGTVPTGHGNGRFGNAFPENFTQWSGEVRLSSPTGRLLDYVVGAYYDSSDYHLHQDSYYVAIGGVLTGHQSTDFQQDSHAHSFYGQGTLNLSRQLRLIGGLRYSHTYKTGLFTSQTVSGRPLNVIGPTRSGTISESYVDPSATLQMDITPKTMAYLSYGRGSKSGGFVSNTYNVAAAGFQFHPERSTNFEAGIKSTFLDGRLTFNLTAFRTEFKDLQQSAYDPNLRTFFTLNAASARSEGVEMETQMVPAESLTVTANMAYLKARFLNYPGAPCLATETVAQCNSADRVSIAAHNIAGYPLQFAPRWSGNVGLRHKLDVGGMLLITDVNAQFRSSYYIADGYSPIWGLQSSWVKFDARLELAGRDDRWSVALIGRNLGDKKTRGAAIRLPGSITDVTRSINWMDEYRSLTLQGTVRF